MLPRPLHAAFRGDVPFESAGAKLPRPLRDMSPGDAPFNTEGTGLPDVPCGASLFIKHGKNCGLSSKKESSQLFFHDKSFLGWYFMLAGGKRGSCVRTSGPSASHVMRRPAGMVVGQMVPGLPTRSRLPRSAGRFPRESAADISAGKQRPPITVGLHGGVRKKSTNSKKCT